MTAQPMLPRLTRRGFLATLALIGTQQTAVAQARGFHVRGTFTATDTERSEHYVNMGRDFAWIVNDDALWANIEPLIGSEVAVTVHPL